MTKDQIKGIMSKKSDYWATPKQLLNRIIYDLDPCPFQNDITNFDGLKIHWFKTVYVNPPYSSINIWVDKCLQEVNNKNVDVIKLLIPARTDTKYFHKLMNSGYVKKIIFFKGRLHFNETKGGTFPSILIYISNDTKDIEMLFYEARGTEIL